MVVKRENGDGVYWAVGEFEAERARKSWKSWTLKWYFFCILEKGQGRKKTVQTKSSQFSNCVAFVIKCI